VAELVLEKMTSPDVARAIEAGHDTVVCPFASVEQHGRHLPLGTDAILGESLGRRVAQRLEAFVAPTVRVGCAEAHMAFPGTVTVSEETLRRTAVDYAHAFARQGFKRIVLLATHGGNFKPLEDAARRCADLEGATVIAPMSDFARDILEPTNAVSAAAGISAGESGSHCGEWETSIILRLAPELVAMERADVGYVGDMEEAVERMLDRGESIQAVSDGTGILGDPRRADAARGELHLEAIAHSMVRAIGTS
jgi:creatinine amidohydrolase